MDGVGVRVVVAAVALAVAGTATGGRVGAAGEIVVTVDATGDVGQFASLVLDASGFPVIAYRDETDLDLKLVHCDDPVCAGGDETVRVLDAGFNVGRDASLQLDASGFPVVAYTTIGAADTSVKLVRCNDPVCAGGDETVRVLDAAGFQQSMQHTSLQLDASGFPVIAYRHASYHAPFSASVKLVRCNDPVCAGGDETINVVQGVDDTGWYVALALDRSGLPVIAYGHQRFEYGALMLTMCNDPWCAGTDETTQVLDELAVGGTSLRLDASGAPVVAYVGLDTSRLTLARCDDARCGGWSVSVLERAGWAGGSPSLQLDTSGHPVISHEELSGRDLVLTRCNDPACTGGDETSVALDTAGDVGGFSSMQLDASGFPVVAYHDATDRDLVLARCDDVACSPDNDGDGTLDGDDALPDDPTEAVDLDRDGVGDNADADDDGDGQGDADELACGTDPRDPADACPDAAPSPPSAPPTVATPPPPRLPPAGSDRRIAAMTAAAVTAVAAGAALVAAAARPTARAGAGRRRRP